MTSRRKAIVASLPLLICGMNIPAFAQDASREDETRGLSEIIVTAQKRAENVQDVPISITAFGGEALAERQIADVASLGNTAPSVNLDAGLPFSGSTAALGAFIRGIGQNDFSINVDPGVGIYLDGVYLARTVGANLDLPDVERVEILKGPQGTLFGRNTIGGAINVVTRDPSGTFGVTGEVTTGRYNRLDVNASVDIPITESLGALVTVSSKNRDGYYKRIPYTQTEPFQTDPDTAFRGSGYATSDSEGGEDMRSGRVKLKWDGSRATVRLAGDFTRVNQSAIPTSVLAVLNTPGVFAASNPSIPGTAIDFTGQTGFNFSGLYNFCIGATPDEIAARNAQNLCGPRGTTQDPESILPGIGSVNVDGDPLNDRLPWDDRWVSTDPDRGYATGPSFSRVTNWGFSGIVDFDLTDDIQLRSITGYRDLKTSYGIDTDNSPLVHLHVSGGIEQWQFSEEVQLLGSLLDNSMNFVLGAYYFKEKADELIYANFSSGSAIQIEGPIDVATENFAFFGQVDWRISDLIGVTLGGRFTKEDKEFEGAQKDYNGLNYKLFNCLDYDACRVPLGFPDPNDPLRIYVPGVQKAKFDNFSPKFGVQLHPNDDVMVYGSYTEGYKTGGWSTRLANPVGFAPDFGEETATTWEVGVKADLLDRRLRTNLAVFSTKYSNIQLLFQEGSSPVIRNAGEARIKGVELEVTAEPVRNFTITSAVGYVDAKLTDVLAAAVSPPNQYQAGLIVGAPLPKVPEWKFNVSPRLELPLGNGGAIIGLVDYTHISSMWNDGQRTYLLRRPSTDMVNATLTYEAPGGGWRISAGGTNITNERFIVNGVGQLAGGLIYGSYNRPAEWFASFGFEF